MAVDLTFEERMEALEKQIELLTKRSVSRRDVLNVLRQRPHDPVETLLPESVLTDLLADSSVVPIKTKFPSCFAQGSGFTVTTGGSDKKANLTSAVWDTDGMIDTANDIITIKVPGVYAVTMYAVFASQTGGTRWGGIYKDGLADIYTSSNPVSGGTEFQVHYEMKADVGDTFEFTLWQDSGVSITGKGEAWVTWVSNG